MTKRLVTVDWLAWILSRMGVPHSATACSAVRLARILFWCRSCALFCHLGPFTITVTTTATARAIAPATILLVGFISALRISLPQDVVGSVRSPSGPPARPFALAVAYCTLQLVAVAKCVASWVAGKVGDHEPYTAGHLASAREIGRAHV